MYGNFCSGPRVTGCTFSVFGKTLDVYSWIRFVLKMGSFLYSEMSPFRIQNIQEVIMMDDPLNYDGIGEKEILVVSFGTSFNDSRIRDIKGIEDAFIQSFPEWKIRRAFTSQMIIDHIEKRDGEKIDNVDTALQRALENGVKEIIIQPTHLMQGEEYDKILRYVEKYRDRFEKVRIAQPLLGEVGEHASISNEDKEAVASIIVREALQEAGYSDMHKAQEDGTAFVFMGHGTWHNAKISYSQMQRQMETLGYQNVFIGTVEGNPEETSCENILFRVKKEGYRKVILRPMMVVAGDHANNDMAGPEEDSWVNMFQNSGAFSKVETQIKGLGEVKEIQELYILHTKAAIK